MGGTGRPRFDASRLLGGNLAGIALVAGSALGVALIGSAVIAFTTMKDFDLGQAVAMTLLLTVATFGADVVADVDGVEFSSVSAVGQYPLLVTVLALGVAVWMFRRVTAARRDIIGVLLDAARAASILMLSIVSIAVVLRIWSPDTSTYEEIQQGDTLEVGIAGLSLVGSEKTFTSILGAIFVTFLLTFVVLAVTALVRRDRLPATGQRVHDWLAIPMLGVAAVALTTALAGLAYLVAILIGNDGARGFGEFIRLVAVTPALGLRLVSLGVFANVGWAGESDGDTQEEFFTRLPDFADDNGFLFWVAPLVSLAVMAAGVLVIVWKSADKSKILRHTLVYLGLLLVALPLMVRFSNAHWSSEQRYRDQEVEFSLWIGVEGVQTTAYFILFSLLVAAAVLFFTGNLDVNSLKGKARSIANRFENQGQSPQQGWGQPNSGQPGPHQPTAPAPGQPYPTQPPQQWGQQPPAQGEPPQEGWPPPNP